jgi:hypothetical protein
MSAAAAAPPPTQAKKPESGTATLVAPATGFGAILGGLAVLPILFLIIFHAGAAYLSYQKYQSGLWAFVNFLFAYFYYPYYAFFLSGTPANVEPSPINTMMGGLRKLFKGGRKH